MINKLLVGEFKEDQERLDKLFSEIGDNPSILWYPSAGSDVRDLFHFSDLGGYTGQKNINLVQAYGIKELPNLFIHTDYYKKLKILRSQKFEYNGLNIKIEKKYKLKINDKYPVHYCVDPLFAVFPHLAYKTPTIYLLDVEIYSKNLKEITIKKPVIYFLFENINFLSEVLLKYGIKVSHILRINEGFNTKGGAKGASVAVAFAFVSVLDIKYLIIDTKPIYFNWGLAEVIINTTTHFTRNGDGTIICKMGSIRYLKEQKLPNDFIRMIEYEIIEPWMGDYEIERLKPINDSPIGWKVFKVININKNKFLTPNRMNEIIEKLER